MRWRTTKALKFPNAHSQIDMGEIHDWRRKGGPKLNESARVIVRSWADGSSRDEDWGRLVIEGASVISERCASQDSQNAKAYMFYYASENWRESGWPTDCVCGGKN